MDYTSEQKKVLDQILLEIATAAPMSDGTDSDERSRPFSQKTIYRSSRDAGWNDLAFKTDIKRRRVPDATDVRVMLPVSDRQAQILSSSGTAAAQVVNLAFADYLRPADGVIKLIITASAKHTATRQSGQHIIDLGAIDMSMTRNAHRSFARMALAGLADPEKAAGMLSITEDTYRAQLTDKKSRLSGVVSEILRNGAFIKGDEQLAELAQQADAAGNAGFAALLNEALAQLPDEVAVVNKAAAVGKASKRNGQQGIS